MPDLLPRPRRTPRRARPVRRGLTAGLVAAAVAGATVAGATVWPSGTTLQVDAASSRVADTSRSQARGALDEDEVAAVPAYRLARRPRPIGRVPGLTLQGDPKPVRAGVELERLPPPEPEADLAALAEQAAQAPAASTQATTPAVTAAAPFSFRVATFNILGSQHTRGSSRYASGTTRAGYVADLVTSRGIDVIGMQEVQDDQLAVLRRRLGGYGNWPGQALGGNGNRLQLFWDAGQFEMVDAYSFTTTFDHQRRPIPVVRLRHRGSGSESWHMVIHNSPRDQERDRDAATTTEIGQINSLRGGGLPVFVVGDMNEKEEWFCRVSGSTGLQAANGGSTAGGCKPPPRPLRIDWIMGGGSSAAGLDWSGYVRDTSPQVRRTSDHDFLHATATITPAS